MSAQIISKENEKIVQWYLDSLYKESISQNIEIFDELNKNTKNTKSGLPKPKKKKLQVSYLKENNKNNNMTPTNPKIPLRPLVVKLKNSKKKRRSKKKSLTRSINNVRELVKRDKDSTKKKIKMYNSKLRTLKTLNEQNEIKSFLKEEWRRVKYEGKILDFIIFKN